MKLLIQDIYTNIPLENILNDFENKLFNLTNEIKISKII
jgi:hypothetical protein